MSALRYVAMRYKAWADQETNLGFPVAATMGDGSAGFLPVYRTREEADAAHPGAEIIVVRLAEEAPRVDE